MIYRALFSSLIYLICLSWQPVAFAAADDEDIEIALTIDGDVVRMEVEFLVDAKPRDVWAVLTDFNRMPEFVSNLTSSRVLSRNRNTLTVEQKGKASAGPVNMDFTSVREIELQPFERIRSRMISGNMKKLEGITQLSEEGGKTRVKYRSDGISDRWIPPVVGRSFIESQTREQFAEMREEVMKRKQALARR